MATGQPPQSGPWFRSRSGLVLLAFLAVAGFFLVTEHTAHVFGALPYLLLLLCPLLHFVHRGHRGRGGHADGHGGHEGDRGPRRDGGDR